MGETFFEQTLTSEKQFVALHLWLIRIANKPLFSQRLVPLGYKIQNSKLRGWILQILALSAQVKHGLRVFPLSITSAIKNLKTHVEAQAGYESLFVEFLEMPKSSNFVYKNLTSIQSEQLKEIQENWFKDVGLNHETVTLRNAYEMVFICTKSSEHIPFFNLFFMFSIYILA